MRKTVKNAFQICYSKRQCVSAYGGLRPLDPLPGTPLGTSVHPDPLACAVLTFPFKIPAMGDVSRMTS